MFLSYMDIFGEKKMFLYFYFLYITLHPLFYDSLSRKHTHTLWLSRPLIEKHSSIPKKKQKKPLLHQKKKKIYLSFISTHFPSFFFILLLYWDLLSVCFDCVAPHLPPLPHLRPSWLPLSASEVRTVVNRRIAIQKRFTHLKQQSQCMLGRIRSFSQTAENRHQMDATRTWELYLSQKIFIFS